MFTRAGFFHFGTDHGKPIDSLRAALIDAEETSGALLVLPEAFNIGKPYRDVGERCDYHPVVLRQLLALSAEFDITFVAGLIVRRVGMREWPPLNAAHLISGPSRCEVICYKRWPDNTDNYTPCPGMCDVMNPLSCNGHWIGAIICRDLDDAQRSLSLQERFESLDQARTHCRFFCVPGHMYKYYFGDGAIGTTAELRPDSRNTVTIMANSDPHGCRSFITNGAGQIIVNISNENRATNKVVLEPLGRILSDQ
jgi:hypothetical protein